MELVIMVGSGWLVSLGLHEFGHALVAYWGGDHSVKDKGYLTLNPLKYTDPTLSLILPLFFLLLGGLALPGGAVYINRRQLRGRGWESAVAAAGPLANALVALLLALLLHQAGLGSTQAGWFWQGIALLGLLQISAVLLNLLPIPPLDGYGILEPWLPPSLQQSLHQVGRYGIWIVFALFWFVPAFSRFFWGLTAGISDRLGVPLDLAWQGYETFRDRSLLLLLGLIVLAWLCRSKEQGLYQRGRNHLRARRYAQALTAFEQAVQHHPDYYEAWYERGHVLVKLQRYEEALASYHKAIQIQPEAPDLWFNRGLVLLELEQWEAAAQSFAKAGERTRAQAAGTPGDRQLAVYSCAYRGQALAQLGQVEEALAAYQQAAALDPTFQSLWLWQADLLEQQHREEEALAALDQALNLNPAGMLRNQEPQPELWVRRGALLNRLGRPEAAFSDCEQAIAAAPDSAPAWLQRGIALRQLDRLEEARDSYAQALTLEPALAAAWYHQAGVQAALGDREAAFTALAQAYQLAPELWLTLAQSDPALVPLHPDPRWFRRNP